RENERPFGGTSMAIIVPTHEVFLTGTDLSEDTIHSWAAVVNANQPPRLFRCCGDTIWLAGTPGALEITIVDATVLRRFATDHVKFLKWNARAHMYLPAVPTVD